MHSVRINYLILLVIIGMFLSAESRGQPYSYYVSPEHETAVFSFQGGQVEVYSGHEVILAKLDSGTTYEFTLEEVIGDIAEGPFEQSALMFELKAAVEDPTAA